MEKTEDILVSLINTSSYNTNNNNDIVNHITNYLKDKVQEIKLVVCNNNKNVNNIVVGVNTKLKNVKNAIVFSGHLDTVLPSNNNIVAYIKDNKVFGLGACDMKAYFSVLFNNLETLKNHTKPIIFVFTADEETALNGVNNVINFFKQNNIVADFCLLGEPTNKKIVVANKGCYDYKVVVNGKSCHSSDPSLGVNAIYVASKIALMINKLNKKLYKQGISLNVGIINGGKRVNMVPDQTTFNFDLRVLRVVQSQKVINKINKYINKLSNKYKINIELKNNLFLPPFEESKEHITKKILQALGLPTTIMFGGTEAGYYQMNNITTLVFGPGNLSFAHSENEHIAIDDLYEYENNLLKLLEVLK